MTNRLCYAVASLYLALIATPLALSQPPAPETPPAKAELLSAPTRPIDFDVALFRPSSDKSVKALNITPDGLIMGARPFHDLIRFAFAKGRGGDYRMSGQPAWVDTDLYDVQAKVAPEDVAEWQQLTPLGQKVAVQGFIIQYLKLKYHPDPAPYPYYALVVGKNGPKMPLYKPGDSFKARDGHTVSDKGAMLWIGPNELIGQGCTMQQLAEQLDGRIDRGVLNQTGLSQDYNFDLRFKDLPDPAHPDGPGVPFRRLGPHDAAAVLVSSIKELGLELQPATGPTDGMIIDHIERPPKH